MDIPVLMRRGPAAMAVAAGMFAFSGAAFAGGPVLSLTYTADENGSGFLYLPEIEASLETLGAMTPDTSAGGLPSALWYTLGTQPNGVQGDVLILEYPGGPVSDVIRFRSVAGQFGFFFYSDIDGVPTTLADVGLPALPVTGNFVVGVESLLPDGSMGFVYTPLPGMPGHVTTFNATYVFISDLIPAPGAAAVLGIGGLLAARRRR